MFVIAHFPLSLLRMGVGDSVLEYLELFEKTATVRSKLVGVQLRAPGWAPCSIVVRIMQERYPIAFDAIHAWQVIAATPLRALTWDASPGVPSTICSAQARSGHCYDCHCGVAVDFIC